VQDVKIKKTIPSLDVNARLPSVWQGLREGGKKNFPSPSPYPSPLLGSPRRVRLSADESPEATIKGEGTIR